MGDLGAQSRTDGTENGTLPASGDSFPSIPSTSRDLPNAETPMRHRCLTAVLLCLPASPLQALALAPAPPQDESIPARTRYKGRRIAQTMHFQGAPWLVRESRERQEECSTLLRVLGVRPQARLCHGL